MVDLIDLLPKKFQYLLAKLIVFTVPAKFHFPIYADHTLVFFCPSFDHQRINRETSIHLCVCNFLHHLLQHFLWELQVFCLELF